MFTFDPEAISSIFLPNTAEHLHVPQRIYPRLAEATLRRGILNIATAAQGQPRRSVWWRHKRTPRKIATQFFKIWTTYQQCTRVAHQDLLIVIKFGWSVLKYLGFKPVTIFIFLIRQKHL